MSWVGMGAGFIKKGHPRKGVTDISRRKLSSVVRR
jgi:hypothetical protein